MSKKNLSINDFDIRQDHQTSYISWENLEEVMGKELYAEFGEWMRGQTSLIYGAYPWDVERFIKGKPIID